MNNNQILKFTPVGDFLTGPVRLVLKEKVDLIDQCSSTIQKIALIALSTLCLVLTLGVSYQIGLNCRIRKVEIAPLRDSPQGAGAAAQIPPAAVPADHQEEPAADADEVPPAHEEPVPAQLAPAADVPLAAVPADHQEEPAADADEVPPAHEEPVPAQLAPVADVPLAEVPADPLAGIASSVGKIGTDILKPLEEAPVKLPFSLPLTDSLYGAGAASGAVGGAGTADSPLAAVATDVEIDFDTGVYKNWLAIIKNIVVKKNTLFSKVTHEQLIEFLKERLREGKVDLTAIQTILAKEKVEITLDDLPTASLEALKPDVVDPQAKKIQEALLDSEEGIIKEIIQERLLKEQIDVDQIEGQVKYDVADLENLLIFCLKNGSFETASVVFAIEEAVFLKKGGDRFNQKRLCEAVESCIFEHRDLQEIVSAEKVISELESDPENEKSPGYAKTLKEARDILRPVWIAETASVFIKKLSFTDEQLRKIFSNAAKSNAQLSLIASLLRLKGKFFFKNEYCNVGLKLSLVATAYSETEHASSLMLIYGNIYLIMFALRFGTSDNETRDKDAPLTPAEKQIHENFWNHWSTQTGCYTFFRKTGCFSKVR